MLIVDSYSQDLVGITIEGWEILGESFAKLLGELVGGLVLSAILGESAGGGSLCKAIFIEESNGWFDG